MTKFIIKLLTIEESKSVGERIDIAVKFFRLKIKKQHTPYIITFIIIIIIQTILLLPSSIYYLFLNYYILNYFTFI